MPAPASKGSTCSLTSGFPWYLVELGSKSLRAFATLHVVPCRYFIDTDNPLTVENPPGSKCSQDFDTGAGLCFAEAQRPNRFMAHGAVIGGPKTPDDAGDPDRVPYSLEGWNDWRMDWIGNEQALDYNAAYSMALALAIELPSSFWDEASSSEQCGGTPCFLQMC